MLRWDLSRRYEPNHIITALVSNQFSTTTADGLSPTGARPSTDAIIIWNKPVCQSFNGDMQKATVLCPKLTMAIIIKKISAERLVLTWITRDIISNSPIFPINTTYLSKYNFVHSTTFGMGVLTITNIYQASESLTPHVSLIHTRIAFY